LLLNHHQEVLEDVAGVRLAGALLRRGDAAPRVSRRCSFPVERRRRATALPRVVASRAGERGGRLGAALGWAGLARHAALAREARCCRPGRLWPWAGNEAAAREVRKDLFQFIFSRNF